MQLFGNIYCQKFFFTTHGETDSNVAAADDDEDM